VPVALARLISTPAEFDSRAPEGLKRKEQSGCSSVCEERLAWNQEGAGSNPAIPTRCARTVM
jgi:hypothetical protein